MKEITRRQLIVIAAVAAARAGLNSTPSAVEAGSSWSSRLFDARQDPNIGNPNAFSLLEVWDGRDICTSAAFIVPPGLRLKTSVQTQGTLYEAIGADFVEVSNTAHDLMNKKRKSHPDFQKCDLPVLPIDPTKPETLPPGWSIVRETGTPTAIESTGNFKLSEGKQFKSTKPEDRLGSKEKYSVASIWDGRDPRTRIIVVLDRGVVLMNLGTTEGTFYEGEGDFGLIQKRAGEMADELRQSNPKFTKPVPTLVIGPGQKSRLLGAWQFAPESRVKVTVLDPYRGVVPEWNPQTQLISASRGEKIRVGSEKRFKIVQGWDASNPESTVGVLVGPGWELVIDGPFVGTEWEASGDLGQLKVRVLEMAREKGPRVPSVWAHTGQPPLGYSSVPDQWSLE